MDSLNGLQKHNNYANREIVAAYEGYWNDIVLGGKWIGEPNREKGKYYNFAQLLACIHVFLRSFTSALVVFLMASPVLFGPHCRHSWYRYLIDAKIEEMEYYIERTLHRKRCDIF